MFGRLALLAVVAMVLCPWSGAVSAAGLEAKGSNAKIVVLGTGTPIADPERSGPAVAVVVNDSAYLIDSGPGIVRRASAAHMKGIKALAVGNLKTVFITHLHSDHTLGLPDLIFSPWVLEREEPLAVYGPPGTADMIKHLLAAYRQDIHMRLYGLEPANHEGYKVDVHEISSGMVYQDESVSVEAIAVDHGSWPSAFGYKFTTPDKIIVVSGDTGPSEALVTASKGADILLHEVYSRENFKNLPSVWRRYHASFHTSTKELADIANRTNPGLLVLYHQLFMGGNDDTLVKEVEADYKGAVVSARDLDVFE